MWLRLRPSRLAAAAAAGRDGGNEAVTIQRTDPRKGPLDKETAVKLAVLSLALLVGSLMLAAHAASQSAGQTQFSFHPGIAISSGCPVSMKLEHSGLLQLRKVRKAPGTPGTQPYRGFRTELQLLLTALPDAHSNPRQIAGARLTAYGYNGNPSVILISGNVDPSSEIAKTMDVKFAPGGDRTVSANLLLPGFAAARSIDLDSITYADGSTWTPAAGQRCTVTPDPFMLVDARVVSAPR